MMRTKTCPKCRSTDIVRIPGWKNATGYTSNVIPTGLFSGVYVTRLLCMACGYLEEWVETKEDREKVRQGLEPRGRKKIRKI
ncbi:MAG: hypothetical protein FWF10_06950 [Clostridiales bacterium]|nr:hypothetical protein [Clostridiales bacterium]